MKCEVIQDLLSRYIEQVCSDETKKIVEEHLCQCETCQALYQDLLCNQENQPSIKKKIVFKKIKRYFSKKGMLICAVFLFLVICFGTKINCLVLEWRMKARVAMLYGSYDFIMSDFEYVDLDLNGNYPGGYYIARFVGNGEDMVFNVYTESHDERFWLKLKDNFNYQIIRKDRTFMRLQETYAKDVKNILAEEMSVYDVFANTQGADSDELLDKIELNMPYQRDIDQTIPLDLDIWLETSSKQKDVEEIKKKVITILKEHDFHPATLSISFQDGTYILMNAEMK